jgi:hypothetical protein
MWHRPRLASVHGRDTDANQAFFTTFWKLLYKHKADLILNAHIHVYERFAPETPDGTRDYESGIPRFVVGTGGNGCCRGAAPKNPAHRKAYGEVLGFLELKLYPSRYTFKFKAIDDQPAERFSDSGKRMCRWGDPHRHLNLMGYPLTVHSLALLEHPAAIAPAALRSSPYRKNTPSEAAWHRFEMLSGWEQLIIVATKLVPEQMRPSVHR